MFANCFSAASTVDFASRNLLTVMARLDSKGKTKQANKRGSCCASARFTSFKGRYVCNSNDTDHDTGNDYICMSTYLHMYIYIYRERERDR